MSIVLKTGDIILSRLEFQNVASGVGYNILHWRVDNVTVTATGLPPAVDPSFGPLSPLIAEEIYDLCNAQWALAASTQATFTGVTVQNIAPAPRSLAITHQPAVPTAGLVVGDMLPSQDAPTILKRTEFGERWGLGRMFFYGLAEADQNQGIMTAGAVIRVNTFAHTIDGPVIFGVDVYTVTLRPVLYHGVDSGGQPLYSGLLTMELSNNIIKTQRRRRPGKGI